MSYFSHLQCSFCDKTLGINQSWNLCPDCHKPLLARYDYSRAAKLNRYDLININEKSIWRYQQLLPVLDNKNILSLGEGWSPLIHVKNLGRELNFNNLFIKDEGNNPTGSFKARGLSVAVSRAFELGIKKLSIPSAGNAAGAMSAYAALASMSAHVYMPNDVPKSFIIECKTFGAQINLVDGLITDCAKRARIDIGKFGRFDLSTLKEPYRIEGKKTMGYELAEQFDWELPDMIIYPTGGGTGLIGMWKAFDEMEKLGWISSKRPHMVVVQAEGCAPIVRAFHKKYNFAEIWENAQTVADGLRVPGAIGDFLILDILYKSNGLAIKVSDEDMLRAVTLIGKTQGLFVSPESGATLAAFHKLLKKKLVSKNDRVVLFSTGSGYKYLHLFSYKKSRR